MIDTLPEVEVDDELDDIRESLPWYVRWGRAAVALVAVVGMLYLSGAHEYFLFQRTPERIEQEEIESELDAMELLVPVKVLVLQNEEAGGSVRDEEDARRLVENAARIWEQANITLVLDDIVFVPVTAEEMSLFRAEPRQFMAGLERFDPGAINVFLIGVIGGGINGLSFGGVRAVMVADFTSVYDFRTLAHEIGHQLGLGHVAPDRGRLMFRGANGFALTAEEIARARSWAERF